MSGYWAAGTGLALGFACPCLPALFVLWCVRTSAHLCNMACRLGGAACGAVAKKCCSSMLFWFVQPCAQAWRRSLEAQAVAGEQWLIPTALWGVEKKHRPVLALVLSSAVCNWSVRPGMCRSEGRTLRRRIVAEERWPWSMTCCNNAACVLVLACWTLVEKHTASCAGLEAQFMAEVAKERWPVLIAIFCFDIVTYTFRLGARAILGGHGGLLAMLVSLLPQLTNMVALYGAIHFINRRSRCTVRAGYQARAGPPGTSFVAVSIAQTGPAACLQRPYLQEQHGVNPTTAARAACFRSLLVCWPGAGVWLWRVAACVSSTHAEQQVNLMPCIYVHGGVKGPLWLCHRRSCCCRW